MQVARYVSEQLVMSADSAELPISIGNMIGETGGSSLPYFACMQFEIPSSFVHHHLCKMMDASTMQNSFLGSFNVGGCPADQFSPGGLFTILPGWRAQSAFAHMTSCTTLQVAPSFLPGASSTNVNITLCICAYHFSGRQPTEEF